MPTGAVGEGRMFSVVAAAYASAYAEEIMKALHESMVRAAAVNAAYQQQFAEIEKPDPEGWSAGVPIKGFNNV